jgi:phenylacetate-CoA ligase
MTVTADGGSGGALSEAERHPLIDHTGRTLLAALLEHEDAPRWNHTCGERLDPAGLGTVQAFARDVRERTPAWAWGTEPAWLAPFVDRCLATVPAYRRLGPGRPRRLVELPTISREDVAASPPSFLPDGEPLDDLVVHATSGTGGRPMPVLQTPVVVAAYYPLVQAALAAHGAAWPTPVTADIARRPVAWMTVAYQADTYVLASRSAYLAGAVGAAGGRSAPAGAAAGVGTAKLNLHEGAWRRPTDRRRFVAYCDPAVVTGDPLALEALCDLDVELHLLAAVTTSSAAGPGRLAALRRKLKCPVIDIYAATEIGPVAYSFPDGGGHALVQPALYVEILDPAGAPCLPGERGEITVTGGMNPMLPLLRYRTGDFAALEWRGRRPVLVAFEGRPCVTLRTASGRAVNTIDVTKALATLALERWSVHQGADGSVVLRVPAEELHRAAGPAAAVVAGVLGAGDGISVEALDPAREVAPFTSELVGE